MTLLMDIGNSRVKWTRLQEGGLQPMHAAAYPAQQFDEWCNHYLLPLALPAAVRVANVAGPVVATALSDWCQRHWDVTPYYAATARSAVGITNGYENVAEMGVDRWLAMLAARQLSQDSFCVISCGTAVTLDAVTADGTHLGGLILPGPGLLQELLNTATRGVNAFDLPRLQLELGRSTRHGVAAGSAFAFVGLIERTLEQLRQTHVGHWQCLITGGAATHILPLCREPMTEVPDLVLQGLAL